MHAPALNQDSARHPHRSALMLNEGSTLASSFSKLPCKLRGRCRLSFPGKHLPAEWLSLWGVRASASQGLLELPEGFHEGHGLDVPHHASQLDDAHIRGSCRNGTCSLPHEAKLELHISGAQEPGVVPAALAWPPEHRKAAAQQGLPAASSPALCCVHMHSRG